jgi:hypothetical protein
MFAIELLASLETPFFRMRKETKEEWQCESNEIDTDNQGKQKEDPKSGNPESHT